MRLLLPLLAASLAPRSLAIGDCDAGDTCTYSFAYGAGKSFTMALRPLCNSNGYSIVDSAGHSYYAQICGTSSKACLPFDWQNQYEYGRVIQTWGGPPACNQSAPECTEESTGLPTCCTEPCQVIAVGKPQPRLIDPAGLDASQGFELFYIGEAPTKSDPYTCDYDPGTNAPYPRTTHMQFLCDWSADGFARLSGVVQNATDDCDYTLRFKTRAACVGAEPLSGGWVFDIIVITVAGVYWLGASAVEFRRSGAWALPPAHRAFFAAHCAVALEGLLFILNRCRKPRREALEKLLSSDGDVPSKAAATAAPPSVAKFGGGYGSSASTDL